MAQSIWHSAWKSGRAVAWAGLMALGLAACQSAGPSDVLDIDDALPAPAQETVGNGPVSVTLLLPRSSAQPTRAMARDAFDGAKLAATELGGGQIRLVTFDTKGQPDMARDFAQQSLTAGTKLILTGFDDAAAAAVAAISAKNRPPLIDLSSAQAPAKGVFAFASDEIDSALEGIRTAAAAGQKKVVIVAPEGFPTSGLDRPRRGIARNQAALASVISYPAAENAVAAALAAKKAEFAKATTLVIFGAGRAPANVARAIAAGGYAGSVTTLVGNSSWPQQIYSETVLDGALIAMIDQSSLTEINARYNAATHRPLSLEAAYAYDAVALAAGLVRTRGADAITGKALTAKSGFRGAAGIFRFDSAGNIERRHAIYRIEAGKLKRLSPEIEGF